MNLGEPRFFGPENHDRTRSLKEVMSLNDNGDFLIEQLKLKGLKAKPVDAINEDTEIMNDSGTFENEMAMSDGLLRRRARNLKDFQYKKYPLIDLGTNGEASIAIFAQDIGVSGVVAVDVASQIDVSDLNSLKKQKEYKDKEFPVLGLKIDMLELLRQLPDNSCNVSLFAIDQWIIKSFRYRLELFKELYRIVPDDGLIFGKNSIMSSTSEDDWENLMNPPISSLFPRVIGIFKKVIKHK